MLNRLRFNGTRSSVTPCTSSGIVGTPVEIKHLPSGKVVAWTRLAVKKSANDTSWINLTFWDDLAQVASQHVEKGHQIYVSGRLISDSVEIDEGKAADLLQGSCPADEFY
ncbi:hypothetical protein OIU78_021814 [Salix suchowensis]|nr:hypothetical protein OIU78_021814 [Salix suchowensis]